MRSWGCRHVVFDFDDEAPSRVEVRIVISRRRVLPRDHVSGRFRRWVAGACWAQAAGSRSPRHHQHNYGKDPGDPQWKDDAGIKAYFAFMDKYYPEGDKINTVNSYGYATRILVHICVSAATI